LSKPTGRLPTIFSLSKRAYQHRRWARQIEPGHSYVERSVAASFELSDKILRAKDLQDALRIQTEFFQKQLQALTEQSEYLGDAASKKASEVVNIRIK
jgi:hypothetical protein